MSLINISNLTFAYEGSYDNIFDNVSFQIDTDWKLGFTGRNGRGKTTFLNLLLGKYDYSGIISSSLTFDYFPYEVKNKQATSKEVVAAVCPDYREWEIIKELSLLEVPEEVLERPYNSLSNGEQTKLLLAALFLNKNRFLLIDEPTNHLDMQGREKVSRYLDSKKGYILVSHDRTFLDGCVDHILSINRANIEIQKGNFSSWHKNKQLRDDFEIAENKKIKRDIKRLEASARQSADWADKVESVKTGRTMAYHGEQSRRMQKRRLNLERRQNSAIEEKSKLLKNLEKADNLKITQLSHHANIYAALRNISITYGEKQAVENVTFTIERGDRVALYGKNGSGKSSIIKLLCRGRACPSRPDYTGELSRPDYTGELSRPGYTGELSRPSYTGELNVASGLKISYVSQDTAFLAGNLKDFATANNIDESLFKAILRKLDLSRIQLEKDMEEFSGGQKKKVLIARSLCEKAHLLIWDEPLNFIDVISRMQIEELLLIHKPTILFVEHDSIFCDKIATKKVML